MCNDRIYILLTRKLSGEATLTELKELDILVSSLPHTDRIIKEITGIWNQSPEHDIDFMEATYLAHLERMKDKGLFINQETDVEEQGIFDADKRSSKRFSIKNIALVSLLCICMAGGWFVLSSRTATTVEKNEAAALSEVKTSNGTRTKLKLPDGSDVWLNAGSKLNYNKNFANNRQVYLSGEAFFDVVKNPSKPFVIHTAAIDVRVLGTQFNVKAYDEDITTETSLIRGSVEVFLKKDPTKKYLLKPNEKLVLSNEVLLAEIKKVAPGKIYPGKVEVEKPEIQELTYLDDHTNIESSWTRNILSFEDELFSEVAKKMERWYDVTIKFKKKRWEGEYMSGSFEKETIEQAMVALKYSTGFNFKVDGKTVIIF
jgi:ferric-dicitrate binding protein FerR (iron transport regulator)